MLAISDGRAEADSTPRFEAWIEALATARIDAVQIREKQLDDRALYERVVRAVHLAEGRLDVLVNGRADVAVAAGAAGVHLPSDTVPIARLRRRFGAALLIGQSTHALDEVDAAREAGADYVTYGPVWDTPSKRGLGAPTGLDGLAAAVTRGIPVLALGGVDAGRLAAIHETGAHGAAAIRMLGTPAAIREAADARPVSWHPAAGGARFERRGSDGLEHGLAIRHAGGAPTVAGGRRRW